MRRINFFVQAARLRALAMTLGVAAGIGFAAIAKDDAKVAPAPTSSEAKKVTEQPSTNDAFFEEFAHKRDGIVALTARFHQLNHTADEDRPSNGTIAYAKPRRILFRYDDDNQSVYLLDGTRIYQYSPKNEQVEVNDLGDDPQIEALYLGFDQDAKRLQHAYSVSLVPPEKPDCATKGLELAPLASATTSSDAASPLKKVLLSLRGSDYLPCFVHVFLDDDSEVKTDISDIKILVQIDPAQMQIELPEGTRIITDNKKVETVGKGGKRIPEAPLSSTSPPVASSPSADTKKP